MTIRRYIYKHTIRCFVLHCFKKNMIFIDNIRMEPLQEEPGPLTRSKKPLPSLSSSPSIEGIY